MADSIEYLVTEGSPNKLRDPLLEASRSWLAFALLCAARFMVMLDLSVVVLALPALQSSFKALALYDPVGPEYLRAQLWGVALVGRQGGGPFRQASNTDSRLRNLFPRIAPRRPCTHHDVVYRRSCSPGDRGRYDISNRFRHGDYAFRRRKTA